MKAVLAGQLYHKIFYDVILPIRMELRNPDIGHEIQRIIKEKLLLLESYLKEGVEVDGNIQICE